MGLQGFMTSTRPALLTSIKSRTAPLCARAENNEPWVDFDESGDECVISNEGRSCFEFEVSDPIPIDGIDEERRRKSPGLQNNFYDISTSDFRKPWTGSASSSDVEIPFDEAPSSFTEASSSPDPGRIDDERLRRSPGIARNFWDMSNADFRKPWTGAEVSPYTTTVSAGNGASTPAARAPAASDVEAPLAAADVDDLQLMVRLAQLEQSNKQLEAAAAAARAREDALLRRVAALESTTHGPLDGNSPAA